MLKIRDLKVSYGGICAVKGIDLDVAEGELVTLIGANGAGKTTTMKAITNLQKWQGTIEYQGQSIATMAAHELPAKGLVMVPEGRGVFARMTVHENITMGAYTRNDTAGIKSDAEKMFDLFPRLRERQNQLAGTLSGGEQQMLAMARALMTRPKLLLLDEPTMGLSPIMINLIFDVIKNISKQGITVLLVEQNAKKALHAANRAYLMASGEMKMNGNANEMAEDPEVIKHILGD